MNKKKLLEAIKMIKPTSKASLKQTCLYLCRMDVSKAERMYEFLIKDVGNSIPDVEPESRPFIQNFGEQANNIFAWLRENQDMLGQGVEFIKGIVKGKKAAPLPPINE